MAMTEGLLRSIFTCGLPASHLVLILLWNKNEVISFLLLNGLLLMLLTHVFSPVEICCDEFVVLLSHPAFHTLNKYKDGPVGRIWSYKHDTTLYLANTELPRSHITACKTHTNKYLSQVFSIYLFSYFSRVIFFIHFTYVITNNSLLLKKRVIVTLLL